ncbi:related to Ribosome biogenesis protein ALB1 [Saccharomycodes ludwigii]|uniref:Related to Ribosome biogenesis protein ALB1 n=1 Tax=Saccharomycodes ludwigii TaxID=36035 RepID=A0A376B6F4_9ASCO|nr:hypothetical protein SCDLUD_002440 [Saccharomycodes ludwigii]KAH3900977.1 hypothetical protein SCDLUD_002440 [Saccharomycodes ludwigii]SSD59680.1 related to Ribosome biogenesis protein ALB1 [Saccharomycodes ludwigii]
MPSKNSINRPKDTVNKARKARSLGQKRQQREKNGLLKPSRSSENSKSGQIKSIPIDLYKGDNNILESNARGITTKTLSKKRAKKIERNLKYIQQNKLLIDAQEKAEANGMELEIKPSTLTKNVKTIKEDSQLTKIKNDMWSVIEDAKSTGLILEGGNGTTLGGAYFP